MAEIQYPFSLLYIDIDNFKRVNDQYGHKAGDDTLRAVAATMKNRARDSDILARVGGDEFILLLANTDTGAATALAEELLQTIEIGYQAESNRPLSVSIGLSSHGLEDKSIDCVVQRADKALYSAKSNGRNQLSVFPA
ncbi:MAG: GGDEF domain-containing protein [Gammaproteobacteria bacterium]